MVRWRSLWLWLAWCLLVGSGLLRVWVHQENVSLGYALSAEERRHTQLSKDLERLQVEWSARVAPARLVSLASKLGLRPPEPHEVLVVRKEGPAVASVAGAAPSPGAARLAKEAR